VEKLFHQYCFFFDKLPPSWRSGVFITKTKGQGAALGEAAKNMLRVDFWRFSHEQAMDLGSCLERLINPAKLEKLREIAA
jgi:hypothetical protein